MRLLLIALFISSSSCAYLSDRGMDFMDQFRGVAGFGTGGGIRACGLGLVDTGLIFGIKPQASSFGWKYGRLIAVTDTTEQIGIEVDQSWVIMTTRLENWAYGSRTYKMGKKSFFLLPAIFTWVDLKQEKGEVWYTPEKGVEFETDHYLWSRVTLQRNPYTVFHAFDVEFEIAVVAYLDLGFSPGETVDLLLGVFTIDLADDDGRVFKDGL